MRINFVKIKILEVKHTKNFYIELEMPPMQMDINDPLYIGKEELTSQK